MNEQVYPVSVLVGRIKNVVRQNIPLQGILIQGEVSNLTKHRTGHYYFSLKDAGAQIDCVMFSSYARSINFDLKEGMSVLASGYVDVYEQRGQLQLYVRSLRPDGIGALYLQLEQNRKMLEQEGVFSSALKIPKPHGIQKIGLVTAKEGAALHDVLATIGSRWPMAELHLFPTLVQGKNAPASIVKALDAADHAGMDAVLLVRGGGSFEDLFCFNDPAVVRKVAAMNTYIVTGIGHEVDTSLADFAADTATRTPTAAAQWIVPDQKDVYQWFETKRESLVHAMQSRLDQAAYQLMQYESNPYLADPKSWLMRKQLALHELASQLDQVQAVFMNRQQQRLTQLRLSLMANNPRSLLARDRIQLQSGRSDLIAATKQYVSRTQDQIRAAAGLLDAFSPLKILSRGYAVVYGPAGIMTDSSQAAAGDAITVRLHKGSLSAVITEETNNG